MKQLNNSSTPKGRKVFKRRILFFLFLFNSSFPMPVPPKLMSVRHSINKSLLSLPAAIKVGCYNYSFTI